MSISDFKVLPSAMLSSSVDLNDLLPSSAAAKAKLATLVQNQFEQTNQPRLEPVARSSAEATPLSTAGENNLWFSSLMAVETLMDQVLEQFEVTSQPRPELSLEVVKVLVGFFENMIDLIGLIDTKYRGPYTHILESYQKFFGAFSSKITGNMQWWINGADEGKKVTINGGEFHRELDKLISDFSLPNAAAVLFPKLGQPAATLEEAQLWHAALGLPTGLVALLPTGGFGVVMDLTPINAIKAGTPRNYQVWDTAKFQAWQHGFNAQEERMKNQLQSFTQKYSSASSLYDSINNRLSANLKEYTEMLKHMTTL